MIKIFRAQTSNKEGIDTTVKSAEAYRFLAPTWHIVMGHKNKLITDSEYTIKYLEILDGVKPKEWLYLIRSHLSLGKVTFKCYCHNGKFCHTYILARYLSVRAYYLFDDHTNSVDILNEDVVKLIDEHAIKAAEQDYIESLEENNDTDT